MTKPHDFPPERHDAVRPLVVGLVNFMQGDASKHTERQFRTLLTAAARGRAIALHALPLDAAVAACADAPPDALIVTGASPTAARLADEPSWPMIAGLVDFAASGRIPTIWSCLAAHAAVLHLDGIERVRLPRKLSALVDCLRTDRDHWLARGLPSRWRVPHSRCNEVPEAALRARNYSLISRSPRDGADIFVMDSGPPFVFCQGHPEYDADTLLREHRRDVREFLAGARAGWPDPPEGLLDERAMAALAAFRERAEPTRDAALMADFPWETCTAALHHAWRDVAVALYANWIDHLIRRRADRRAGPPQRGAPARSRTFGMANA